MFGLRPVNRYWAIWVVPIILGAACITAPSRPKWAGLVSTTASSWCLSRLPRPRSPSVERGGEGAIAFVAATVLGVVILYFTIQKYPTAPLFAVQLFPALRTAIVVGGAFYLYERRGKSLKPFDRHSESLRQPQATGPSSRCLPPQC